MSLPEGLTILFARPGKHIYRPGYTTRTPDGRQGEIVPTIYFKVHHIKGGIDCAGIQIHEKNRRGKAFGQLIIKDASERTGVSQEDILKYFFEGKNARKEGIHYVLVGSAGNVMDYKSLTEKLNKLKKAVA